MFYISNLYNTIKKGYNREVYGRLTVGQIIGCKRIEIEVTQQVYTMIGNDTTDYPYIFSTHNTVLNENQGIAYYEIHPQANNSFTYVNAFLYTIDQNLNITIDDSKVIATNNKTLIAINNGIIGIGNNRAIVFYEDKNDQDKVYAVLLEKDINNKLNILDEYLVAINPQEFSANYYDNGKVIVGWVDPSSGMEYHMFILDGSLGSNIVSTNKGVYTCNTGDFFDSVTICSLDVDSVVLFYHGGSMYGQFDEIILFDISGSNPVVLNSFQDSVDGNYLSSSLVKVNNDRLLNLKVTYSGNPGTKVKLIKREGNNLVQVYEDNNFNNVSSATIDMIDDSQAVCIYGLEDGTTHFKVYYNVDTNDANISKDVEFPVDEGKVERPGIASFQDGRLSFTYHTGYYNEENIYAGKLKLFKSVTYV